MPTLSARVLLGAIEAIYVAKGVPPQDAAIVARHQVRANLVGHDSHGIIQTPRYVELIDRGHINLKPKLTIERESPCSVLVDGDWGFGFVITERVLETVKEKARRGGVCVASVKRQGHIGRLGEYSGMLADEGFIGLITADSGAGPKHVAPFGGRERRLGTNPLSIGVPSMGPGRVVLDMATSAVAAGKLGLYNARGLKLPHGWVIDEKGSPSTEPAAFYEGGALLPLGGDQGHKGYGLSFMVEVLSGIVNGLGFGLDPSGRMNDGCFVMAVDVACLRDLAEFKSDVSAFVEYVKSCRPMEGVEEVLYPGEPEYQREKHHLEHGVVVEDVTWRRLEGLMRELGISRPR